jgi:uncharacterized membrane protein (UPF0127 family)
MKKIIFAFIVAVVCLSALFLVRYGDKQTSQSSGIGSVVIGGKKISVETAATPVARAQGLSGRTALCQECGMLFTFDTKGSYTFWMKDMNFDLDMLWIADGKIVQIDKNVPHLEGTSATRVSKIPVSAVLEINAGESDKSGVREGEAITFD